MSTTRTSERVIDAIADSITILGAPLSTTCSSYAKAFDPSKTFTTRRTTPRDATGFTCHTILRVGKGILAGPFTRRPGMADTMPAATSCSNSASAISDGNSRMLTPVTPVGVSNSKSGGIASRRWRTGARLQAVQDRSDHDRRDRVAAFAFKTDNSTSAGCASKIEVHLISGMRCWQRANGDNPRTHTWAAADRRFRCSDACA
jgi:hypothetical protein